MSSLTVTSRIGYAMARDDAFPGSSWLKVVNPRLQVPARVVFMVLVVDCLLLLLPLATPLAFAAITSITTIGFQISYALPILQRVTVARHTFKKSDFHLGAFSVPVAAISAFWLFFTSMIFFWPTETPVDASSMNYTCVVVGAVAIMGA